MNYLKVILKQYCIVSQDEFKFLSVEEIEASYYDEQGILNILFMSC